MKKDTTKGELIPNDVGRPPKYTNSFPAELATLMAQGYTDARICAHWGISRSTFYRWREDKEEFKVAHNRGLERAEAWWEEFGLAGMTGKIPKFNATIYLAFMNNKFNWSRGDRRDGGTQNIHIGSMQVLHNLQQLPEAELTTRIQKLVKDLNINNGEEPTDGKQIDSEQSKET